MVALCLLGVAGRAFGQGFQIDSSSTIYTVSVGLLYEEANDTLDKAIRNMKSFVLKGEHRTFGSVEKVKVGKKHYYLLTSIHPFSLDGTVYRHISVSPWNKMAVFSRDEPVYFSITGYCFKKDGKKIIISMSIPRENGKPDELTLSFRKK